MYPWKKRSHAAPNRGIVRRLPTDTKVEIIGMAGEPNSDKLRGSPSHLLHRAGQCAEEIFRLEMGDRDLTPRQLAILIAVAEGEGASQTDLVERTGIDRSTLADLVHRLQRKRLLQRHRKKEDARTYAVKLTGEGRRMLRATEPVAKRVDQRVLDTLSSKQREDFIGALVSIVDTLHDLSVPAKRRA